MSDQPLTIEQAIANLVRVTEDIGKTMDRIDKAIGVVMEIETETAAALRSASGVVQEAVDVLRETQPAAGLQYFVKTNMVYFLSFESSFPQFTTTLDDAPGFTRGAAEAIRDDLASRQFDYDETIVERAAEGGLG